MICGAADEFNTTTIAVFDNLLACSTAYNDTPHLTPRPFDVKRDGMVIGEGGGAILLEEYEHAKKRGAPILAEVIGFSCTNNGGDMILPSADGIKRTISTGLANARINPEDVDFVSAHATSTKVGDIIEAQAIQSEYWRRAVRLRPEKLCRPYDERLRSARNYFFTVYDAGRGYCSYD